VCCQPGGLPKAQVVQLTCQHRTENRMRDTGFELVWMFGPCPHSPVTCGDQKLEPRSSGTDTLNHHFLQPLTPTVNASTERLPPHPTSKPTMPFAARIGHLPLCGRCHRCEPRGRLATRPAFGGLRGWFGRTPFPKGLFTHIARNERTAQCA